MRSLFSPDGNHSWSFHQHVPHRQSQTRHHHLWARFRPAPPGTNTTAAITFEGSLTRTSCLTRSIIEGQSAFFQVTAFYRGTPTGISQLDWSTASPEGPLIETEGNHGNQYSVIVPFGMKTFDVQATIVTGLGCVVQLKRTFNVVTQDQADAEEPTCRLIKLIQQLIHIYRWPVPIPLPGPPPPWYDERDFVQYPLTHAELNDVAKLGEHLIKFAQTAEPLVRAEGDPG